MFELSETSRQLQAAAQKLARAEFAPRAADIDRSEEYPWDQIEEFSKVCGVAGRCISVLAPQGCRQNLTVCCYPL